MDTALSRVEQLLKDSDTALYLHQIVKQADATDREAKASIKVLHAMGQIEVIPTPGRWGARYAWLSTKAVEGADTAPAVANTSPLTAQSSEGAKALAGFHDAVSYFRKQNATRFAVAVPRRPLRIVKSRARAEALALAAVRRGAKGAEVFALTPIGKARRDATFEARQA